MRRLRGLVALALLCACAGSSQALDGRARAIDGDSIEIGGVDIRIWGIDAPELRQRCGDPGREWRCGRAAADAMANLVAGQRVVCHVEDIARSRFGARPVARCAAGGVDLAAAQARAGLAIAYRRFTTRYVAAEAEARAAKRGIWSGAFVEPCRQRKTCAALSGAAPRRDAAP